MVFQDFSTDERLTGEENLWLHAQLFRIPRAAARKRMDDLLALVGLTESRHRLVKTYSGGMRRRLEIIRALVHRPEILILDEPTTGLDAQTRAAIWNHLAELRRQEGLTLLMSTHYIEEAEHCNRIAVLDHGRLAALGSPSDLKQLAGPDRVTVESPFPIGRELQDRYGAAVHQTGALYIMPAASGMALAKQIIAEMGDRITGVTVRRPTLEDAYLQVTGRSIRPDEASGRDGVREQRRRMVSGGPPRR